MKYLIIALLAFPISSLAQTNTRQTTDSVQTIYVVAEQMPQFPGGEEALQQYLNSAHYPQSAVEFRGRVYVTFVVTAQGKITQAKMLRGTKSSLDQDILRVVSEMPDWIPGKQNGKTVSVQYNIGIKY